MPSTVESALKAAGLKRAGVVAWGTKPASTEPGIYVIAMTADPGIVERTLAKCPPGIARAVATVAPGQVLHLPYPMPLTFGNASSEWCLFGRSIGGSFTLFHVGRVV